MRRRQEKDSLGELSINDNLYYGIQTERARLNFPVSGRTVEVFPKMIWAITAVKKAAALANKEIGALEDEISIAICSAADEIMNGQFKEQFPIDIYHGGGGTSFNMNVNEVIANRANEILTGYKGYNKVHPNSHVNMGQSTNDVIPSALHIACYFCLQDLLPSLVRLSETLESKMNEFQHVVKLARTCLQDAVPITLGQQFSGYAHFVKRQIIELENLKSDCLLLTIGATAVGTQLGTSPGYLEKVYQHLSSIMGVTVQKTENFFDGLQNADVYVKISSVLKGIATGMSKIASDLRILSSGPRAGLGEMVLPAVQPGSSIMPGKVNPVIPEMVMQICFQIYGNDLAVTMAADRGELDLNVWEMLIMKNLIESCELLTNGIDLFNNKCIVGLQANIDVCKKQADSSLSISMVLESIVGYETANKLAQEAFENNMTIKEIAIFKKILSQEEAEVLLDPLTLTDSLKSSRLLESFKIS
ncbi:aspartate ammonia-lyase [Paenibacillus sp. 1_12]|uniref:aspartate ammonia-lyase n=1 Tax=Paenibacillus sp. 1_12 TaxID=1566278 RepID=UPI0008E66C26|nr:aspartate ammonia-lyase [Paenibacillus sp. 1_12]SFM46090.1 aspartate ammonia-lyase [Paenibacillus sp. 1_12]